MDSTAMAEDEWRKEEVGRLPCGGESGGFVILLADGCAIGASTADTMVSDLAAGVGWVALPAVASVASASSSVTKPVAPPWAWSRCASATICGTPIDMAGA